MASAKPRAPLDAPAFLLTSLDPAGPEPTRPSGCQWLHRRLLRSVSSSVTLSPATLALWESPDPFYGPMSLRLGLVFSHKWGEVTRG